MEFVIERVVQKITMKIIVNILAGFSSDIDVQVQLLKQIAYHLEVERDRVVENITGWELDKEK